MLDCRTKHCLPTVLAMVAAAALLQGAFEAQAAEEFRPQLLMALPEYCNTPDGMTLDPATNVMYLAAPNFVNPIFPGVIMKIDPDNTLSLFCDMPIHPETKMAGPMGMDIGPDGNLYVADNQFFYDKRHRSRLMRVVIKNGKAARVEVAVDGFRLSNAVIWRGDKVYVSDTFMDIPGKPNPSGIYQISMADMKKGTVHLQPNGKDPRLIATFETDPSHRGDTAGADGLTFDSKGALYTGNFGDGQFSKITLDANDKVVKQEVLISSPDLTCVDGIFCDLDTDEIYIADSERNRIVVVKPDGSFSTLWENDDSDGADGLLDQPCEPLIRGNELIIVNFDMTFPGLRNSENDAHHTLSVIKLDK